MIQARTLHETRIKAQKQTKKSIDYWLILIEDEMSEADNSNPQPDEAIVQPRAPSDDDDDWAPLDNEPQTQLSAQDYAAVVRTVKQELDKCFES